MALALGSAGATAQPAPRYSEYEVKAGFLYNFALLIDWPADTPLTLTLCIVGEDPFAGAKIALDGKPVGRRKLAVRTAVSPDELRACHIVFVPAAERGRLPALLALLKDQPVLTVGDEEGMAADGLIAGFYRAEERIRFEINVDAARRARLPISSRLLKLARLVHDKGRAP